MKQLIDKSIHKNLSFLGCSNCDAKCCGSDIISLTTADFLKVSNYFPIFFYIKDEQISLVYFFYYTKGQKCVYLKDNQCSIYEYRPYACRTYPFSYEHNAKNISFDDLCPEFSDEKDGLKLVDDGYVNQKIVDDFIDNDMVKYSNDIMLETNQYINFCMENNFLSKFSETYSDEVYKNFNPTYKDDLYVIHQPKATVAILKNKKLFENNRFDKLLKAQINSITNVTKF